MLRLVVCTLSLAAPAQLHLIETIFEHGIILEEKPIHDTRYLTIPTGNCNITLYPSNLVCSDVNLFPYWLRIKVVDVRMASTSVSEDLLEVSVRRRRLQRAAPAPAPAGACSTIATVILTANCGPKLITTFEEWEVAPKFISHGPWIDAAGANKYYKGK